VGDQGPVGPAGAKGETGAQGPQGIQGPQGPPAPTTPVTFGEKAFWGYDVGGGINIDAGWTDISLDTEGYKDNEFIHASNSPAIELDEDGVYQITYYVTTNTVFGGTRSDSEARLLIDTGSGYTEEPGTLSVMYNRNIAQGASNGSVTIVKSLSATDKIKIQARRRSGADNIETYPNGCGIVIRKLLHDKTIQVGGGVLDNASIAAKYDRTDVDNLFLAGKPDTPELGPAPSPGFGVFDWKYPISNFGNNFSAKAYLVIEAFVRSANNSAARQFIGYGKDENNYYYWSVGRPDYDFNKVIAGTPTNIFSGNSDMGFDAAIYPEKLIAQFTNARHVLIREFNAEPKYIQDGDIKANEINFIAIGQLDNEYGKILNVKIQGPLITSMP
jgi:hypothetical protein